MRVSKEFQDDLANLINRHSLEQICNIPDFLLAEYIAKQIESFAKTTVNRDKWFNFSAFKLTNPDEIMDDIEVTSSDIENDLKNNVKFYDQMITNQFLRDHFSDEPKGTYKYYVIVVTKESGMEEHRFITLQIGDISEFARTHSFIDRVTRFPRFKKKEVQ